MTNEAQICICSTVGMSFGMIARGILMSVRVVLFWVEQKRIVLWFDCGRSLRCISPFHRRRSSARSPYVLHCPAMYLTARSSPSNMPLEKSDASRALELIKIPYVRHSCQNAFTQGHVYLLGLGNAMLSCLEMG